MPDVPAWLVVLGAVLGYAISFGQHRIAKQANEDTVDTARRAENMVTFRWAAELMASDSEAQRQLGTRALGKLVERPDVTDDDMRLIEAALQVPLAPLGSTWETVRRDRGEVDVVVPDPEREEQEP